jgi:hypothetical protein
MRHEITDSVACVAATSTLNKAIRVLALAAILGIGFTSIACETSHTESDTPGFFGGSTHEETTTTHNPVTGADSSSSSETKSP